MFHTTAYLDWSAATGRSLLMRVISYVMIPENHYCLPFFLFFLFYPKVTGGAISSSPSQVKREKKNGGGSRVEEDELVVCSFLYDTHIALRV